MTIYDEVSAERRRAHHLHGDKSIEGTDPHDPIMLSILTEEVGEVAREFNEAALGDRVLDLDRVRAELVQVAAVACAWVDSIDDHRAGPVDDMARRLAEKMGDPRPCEHTLTDLDERRNVVACIGCGYIVDPNVMTMPVAEFITMLEDGRLSLDDPAVRRRARLEDDLDDARREDEQS